MLWCPMRPHWGRRTSSAPITRVSVACILLQPLELQCNHELPLWDGSLFHCPLLLLLVRLSLLALSFAVGVLVLLLWDLPVVV